MDIYEQIQDVDTRLTDVENNSLSNNVNYDTMNNLTDFMQSNFWYYGQVVLVAGSAVIPMNNITPLSISFVTPSSNLASGATGWHTLSTSVGTDSLANPSLIITSSSGSDTRTVNYWVII